MENGSFKLLESATQRTLHAQNFTRTSTQASIVLTDLLSRYIALLANTCAKYASQAGRSNLTTSDAISALQEAGLSMEDLADYARSEGREMARYTVHTARRMEDMSEYKNVLSSGLREDRDDAFPLFYAALSEELLDENFFSETTSEDIDAEMLDGERTPDFGLVAPVPQMPIEVFPRATAPPLPPSPVSILSSPSRKRPREMEPRPQTPPNIPDHLPPFPRISAVTNELERRSPSPMASIPAVVHPPAVRPENLATSSSVAGPALQASTQASAADYTTPVHYEASSLRDVPEWHLPQPPLSRTTVPKQQLGLATPQTQPSLLAAYHHVLTHPPAKNAVPAANPSRHRIALGLIEQSERQPRWEPPDTLFGSSVPPMPQVARSAPTFPMAITKPPNSPRHELASDSGGKDKLPLPTVQNRSLIGSQRIVPLITQQGSRIPDISRNILTPSIYKRITRLNHPPVLTRGAERLVYGPSIPAPWNSGQQPIEAAASTKEKSTLVPNGKTEDEVKAEALAKLPDAKLYHTWDYEQKRYWESLSANKALKNKFAQMPASLQPPPPSAVTDRERDRDRDTPTGPSRKLSMISLTPSTPGSGVTPTRKSAGIINLGRRDSTVSYNAARRDSMQSYAE